MVGWNQWLEGHEFDQTPGDGERQGSLVCCSLWGRKESDTTERQNNNSKVHLIKQGQHLKVTQCGRICALWRPVTWPFQKLSGHGRDIPTGPLITRQHFTLSDIYQTFARSRHTAGCLTPSLQRLTPAPWHASLMSPRRHWGSEKRANCPSIPLCRRKWPRVVRVPWQAMFPDLVNP